MIIIGDKMKKILWNLFKETGDIKYYLMFSKMEDKSEK